MNTESLTKECGNKKELRHVDDYLEEPCAPQALLAFLHVKRAPAYISMAFRNPPILYATLKEDVDYLDYAVANSKRKVIKAGTLVRVTMASRMGDLGIATRLDQDHGYDTRVSVKDLTDFTDKLHSEVQSLVPRREFIEARIGMLIGVINTAKAKSLPVDATWKHELTDRQRELKSLSYKERQESIKQQKRLS